jgi:peptidoglycan/LPS O-acetylase OafA/YrhL
MSSWWSIVNQHTRDDLVDFIRWVMAFLVLIGHVRGIFFASWNELHTKTVFDAALYVMTGYGDFAVIVFFVLSGYLVGGSLIERRIGLRTPEAFRVYFLKRFARIYIVLLPALGLTLAVDVLGQTAFPPVYAGALELAAVNFAAADRLSWTHAAINILNLQSFFLTPFGSNGPLWSLSYEWWFYVCFGFLMMRSWPGIAIGLSLTVILSILQSQFPFYFAVWFAGAAVRAIAAAVPLKSVDMTLYYTAGLLAGSTFLGLRLTDFPGLNSAAVVTVTFSVFLGLHHFAQRSHKATWNLFSARRLNILLAESSYTLYAIHMPLIVVVSALAASSGADPFRQPPSAELWAEATLLILGLYIVSFAFYFAFERHTQAASRFLQRALAR